MFLRMMLGIPREIDTVMGLHCVRGAAFKLFFIVSPLFYDSGLRLATEGISAKAGRQKRALCCVRWEQVRRGAAALLPARLTRCSPCGCGAALGLHVLPAPPISSFRLKESRVRYLCCLVVHGANLSVTHGIRIESSKR